MAVEKMKMMNLVALKQDAHSILREIVLNGSIHITNAGNSENFTMKYMDSQIGIFNDMGVAVDKIRPYHREKVFKKRKYKELLDQMFDFFNIKEDDVTLNDLKNLNYSEKLKLLDDISLKSSSIKTREDENRKKRAEIKILLNAVEYFSDSDMKISEFYNLKHINFDMGEISKNSWIKLKANYENIKGIVVHLGTSSYGETVIIFTPSVYAKDTKYFIRSLSFDRIELPNVDISFKDFIKNKNAELESLEREQDEILKEKAEFKDKYLQDILGFYYRYKIIEKIEELEGHIAESKNFILLSAFVPESKVESIKNSVEKVSESALIYFEDDNEIPSKFKIPTKLKNNFILRPFEALVKMYSIPDYKETDPTPFFAITYLLLFGMMFGDVGQGLIFVIAGMLLSKKFGVIAKIEELIPALVIRPMNDINTILVATIGLGILMILIAYIINFRNLKMRREFGKLFFDKNGLSGFLFYISFIVIVLNTVLLKNYVSVNVSSMITIVSVVVLVVTSTLMFMKPKLVPIISKTEEKEEFSPVESGFEMFETVMGFFSNTLSFIRVGAFAINHVGLFMAFHALGQMLGSSFGNIFMIVLGNIFIVCLEGLIVFIQAIRLEYYELFSKYFNGEGINYEPLKVDLKEEI